MPECEHEYRWRIVATSNPAYGVMVSDCIHCGYRKKLRKETAHV